MSFLPRKNPKGRGRNERIKQPLRNASNSLNCRPVHKPVGPFTKKSSKSDTENIESDTKKYYKTSWERQVIRESLKTSGLVRTKKKKATGMCTLYWTHHLPRQTIRNLHEGQRANHFPDSWCVGRKDRLIKCIEKAKRNFHHEYDEIVPKTYLLPRDYNEFKKAGGGKKKIFILKPVASSCGKGIKLLRNKNDVDKSRKCIIQRYIKFPYLIDGVKFDLRLYVLVTSFDPLRIYLYREGIVRFASKPYSPTTKATKYSYLTNFSVNKKVIPSDEPGKSHDIKWTLCRFWQYIRDVEGVEKTEACRAKIKDIIIKTLIAADPEITPALRGSTRSRKCCFELYGFDIILDKSMKPWLLEVNISPSLMVKTDVDKQVKFPLVLDMFYLIGILHHRPEKPNNGNSVITNACTHSNTDEAKQKLAKTADRKSLGNHGGLAADERRLLLVHEAELSRKRNFECIFPCPSSCDQYFQLFQDRLNRRNDYIMTKVIGVKSKRKT